MFSHINVSLNLFSIKYLHCFLRYLTQTPNKLTGQHQRTAKRLGQMMTNKATIIGKTYLSPTVLGLNLHVSDPAFAFLPGQWVDVFIPNVTQVGGFSMCSAPSLLGKKQEIHLAIKQSFWPPAHWFHSISKVGDVVCIRVGGDFYYDPPLNTSLPDMIFIAGGVGINPLLSILLELEFLYQKSKIILPKKITLLYSARTEDEVLFKESISELKASFSTSLDYKYFVTRRSASVEMNQGEYIQGRITEEDVRKVAYSSNIKNLTCFICGPPSMTDHFRCQLINIGLLPQQIKYENWW